MHSVGKFPPGIRREKTPESGKKPEPVKVFCRLKPLENGEESTCIKLLSPTVLSLTTPPTSKGIQKEVHCKFQHIFPSSASQSEVFEHIAYPLLEDLLRGKNGLLFTYGVTGSGKTYTLTGDRSNPGIMPKCIHTLFNTISNYQMPKSIIKSDKMNGFEISEGEIQLDKTLFKTPSRKRKINKNKSYVNDCVKLTSINESNLFAVFVSYIEIYNNSVFDLLDEDSGKKGQAKIVREDAQKNMYVNGVVETEVKSAEEAFELFNIGQKRKKMGNTVLNSVSSRSHSIFNIRVVQFQQTSQTDSLVIIPDTNLCKVAQLSLVDLAGSERTNRTRNTGQLLKEASQINKSLSTLRNCLDVLRRNQICGTYDLVPYRDSRLTLLFKHYFEGDGNVSVMVCVNPSVDDFEENLQVMNFAETTQDVKILRPEPKYTPCKKIIQKKTRTPAPSNQVLSEVLPPLLEIKRNFTSYDESQAFLNNFLIALKMRMEKERALEEELDKKIADFRKKLVNLEKKSCRSTDKI